MIIRIKYCVIIFLYAVGVLVSCKDKVEPKEEESPVQTQTPVTITTVKNEPLIEYIELNATSSFLLKNYVKANANGYLELANAKPGQQVRQGEVLFTIKTKEAQSIGNAVNALDSSFRFSGTNSIKAGANGFITQINHQAGDYVQDGEQLAVISDLSSFVFLLDLPYELKHYLANNRNVEILLPDGEKLSGIVTSSMPSVDAVSQTQSMVIKVQSSHNIPENLVAKVRIIKSIKNSAISLPKEAVLTDETQKDFWIMKLIDSTTAIKIGITKGITTQDRVEILSPTLSQDDKILVSGNFGLPDTAKVKIIQ
jgi:multidrug efflux pump subunit AcrA (membrane-fusion protein)